MGPPERTLKLVVAYDGTDYAGWQFQQGQPSIQETVETVIARITGQHSRLVGSGRTDAGVHAREQVASFRTSTHLSTAQFHRALAAELPEDIVVRDVEQVADGFHAIRDCVAKRYRYTLEDSGARDVFQRRYVWHVRRRLDERAMAAAAASLVGRHDFASFQTHGSARRSTERTIHELDVVRNKGEGDVETVLVDVEADGFLYNMVRSIVGTLVEVGRGRRPPEWVAEVLAARDRRRAGMKAPARGLCLWSVTLRQVVGVPDGIRDV